MVITTSVISVTCAASLTRFLRHFLLLFLQSCDAFADGLLWYTGQGVNIYEGLFVATVQATQIYF